MVSLSVECVPLKPGEACQRSYFSPRHYRHRCDTLSFTLEGTFQRALDQKIPKNFTEVTLGSLDPRPWILTALSPTFWDKYALPRHTELVLHAFQVPLTQCHQHREPLLRPMECRDCLSAIGVHRDNRRVSRSLEEDCTWVPFCSLWMETASDPSLRSG